MKSKKEIITIILVVMIIIFLLMMIGIFCIININSEKEKHTVMGSMTIDTNAETDYEVKKEDPLSGRYVELIGFEDIIVKPGDYVSLINPKINDDFLIKYEIKETRSGKLLFETDLIPAGKKVRWEIDGNLKKGTYEIDIVQSPFWMNPETNEYKPLTGGINKVNITVGE